MISVIVGVAQQRLERAEADRLVEHLAHQPVAIQLRRKRALAGEQLAQQRLHLVTQLLRR